MDFMHRLYAGTLMLMVAALFTTAGAIKKPPQRRAVAVLSFHNNSGNKGLGFLANSLAEGVASALSKAQNIRLVERTQLGAVLKEIELQQSGLFDEGAVSLPTGKIPADVLIVGTYTGSSADLSVTVKAVDVKTASVLVMRRTSGSIDDIFGKLDTMMPEFAALLSGGSVAELTVVSVPDGASVYMDGNLLGETPLVSAKVIEGRHQLRIIKKGYRDEEQKIDVAADENRKVDIFLTSNSHLNRPYLDFGGHWFMPIKVFSGSAPMGAVGLGHSFRSFLIRFEFAAPAITSYTYTYKVPYNQMSDKRDYTFYMFNAAVHYHLFDNSVFSPYVGLQLGYTRILESNINTTLYATSADQRIINAITAVGVVGIDFFPSASVLPFVEGRYYTSVLELDRNEINNINFLGTVDSSNKAFRLSTFSIGVGLRVRF